MEKKYNFIFINIKCHFSYIMRQQKGVCFTGRNERVLEDTPEKTVDNIKNNRRIREENYGEVFLEDDKVVFNITKKQRKK
jgi:hypothetical protein